MDELFDLDFVIKRLKKVLISTKLLLVVLVLIILPFLISRLNYENEQLKKLIGSHDKLQIIYNEHQRKTNLLFIWIGTIVLVDLLGSVAIYSESIPLIVVGILLKTGLIIFAFTMGSISYSVVSIIIIVFTIRLVVLLEKRMKLEDNQNQIHRNVKV